MEAGMPLVRGVARAHSSLAGPAWARICRLPDAPPYPPAQMEYVTPAVHGKLSFDCKPQASSLHPSELNAQQGPTKASTIVSKLLPHVSMVAMPVTAAVKVNQAAL